MSARLPNPAKRIVDVRPGTSIELGHHVSRSGADGLSVYIDAYDGGWASVTAYRRSDEQTFHITAADADPKHGWGPLAYDILMEYATLLGYGLSPDKNTVSDAARAVWRYYATRRPDVTRTPEPAGTYRRDTAQFDDAYYVYRKRPTTLAKIAALSNVKYEGLWKPYTAGRRRNPAVAAPTHARLMAWLHEVVPTFVRVWMIESRSFKVCSSISPDFAVFALHHGFPVVVAHQPGHQFNVAVTSDAGLVRVDLSAVQFEACRASLRDFDQDERDSDEYQQTKALWQRVERDPWSAIRVEPFHGGLDIELGLDEIRKLAAQYEHNSFSDPRQRYERGKKLGRIENPVITKRGKKVYYDGKPSREATWQELDENLVLLGPFGAVAGFFGIDPSSSILLVMKDAASAEKMSAGVRDGTGEMPLFHTQRVRWDVGTIDLFWKSKSVKDVIGAVQFIPHAKAWTGGDDDLVITHMAVRAGYRRNKINSQMIDTLADIFKPKQILFYELTDQGREFMRVYGGAEYRQGRDTGR